LFVPPFLVPLLFFCFTLQDAVGSDGPFLQTERLRDENRHPQQTLVFFDIQPDMAVAESSPGGGWYRQYIGAIIGNDQGTYYAAPFLLERAARTITRSR